MKKKKQTLLWHIRKKGAKDLYLFGTIHVQDARVLEDFPIIEDLLSTCKRFAAESNLEELQTIATQYSLSLPDGVNLEMLLGPSKYQKLKSLLYRSFGLPIEIFRDSHPFLVIQNIILRYTITDLAKTQDELLWELAGEKGLERTGVEKATRQLEIYQSIDINIATVELKKMIKKWSSVKENVQKMLYAYLTKDPQKIFKVSKKQAGNLRKLLIYSRNVDMANQIEKYADEMSTFVAIGAGHLGGKKGVLKLLKDKGFSLIPVKTKI